MAADGKYAACYSIAVSKGCRTHEVFANQIQYFCHPDYESTIDTIETCWDPVTNPKKYGLVVPEDWIAH